MEAYAEALLRLWMYPMVAGQAWTEAWIRAAFGSPPEIDRDLPRARGAGRAQLPVPNPHQLAKDRTLFA